MRDWSSVQQDDQVEEGDEMTDQTWEVQRIKVAYDWEKEACQQALGDDDFAELDRIDHRARQLMAYCAAHGWRADASPPQWNESSRIANGDSTHGRIEP